MELINRETNVIDEQADLEILGTINDFPVFMGCVKHDIEQDLCADMTWSISKTNGIVQLSHLVPLDVLYESQHDSGLIGSIWLEHHQKFAKFIQHGSPHKTGRQNF